MPSLPKYYAGNGSVPRFMLRQDASLTALMSAFARAYIGGSGNENMMCDKIARSLFMDEEFERIKTYIKNSGEDVDKYVRTYLAPTPYARAVFCDESVKSAVRTGAEQYVIIGSGYDTFALKNKYDINIFEVDKKERISDKLMRIRRAGYELPSNTKLIPAGASLRSLKDILLKNGFNKDKKTVVSCMGLLYYLSAKEVRELFDTLCKILPDGSEVIFDLPNAHLFSSGVPRVKNMIEMADKSGEPMKSCFGYSELEKLLEGYGFLIYEFLNPEEIQSRFFNSSDGEMTAFECINYVRAVLKKQF